MLDHMDWMHTHAQQVLAAEWQAIVDRAAETCRLRLPQVPRRGPASARSRQTLALAGLVRLRQRALERRPSALFETVRLEESRGRLPYLPFARVPYYLFVGRKSAGKAG